MKIRGFTLIELMITIAILAILMGIAIPAYNKQIEKSRRADAITGLLQSAQQLERCFTRFNSYNDSRCTIPATSPDGHYTISQGVPAAGDPPETTYELEAKATGAQESDKQCRTFALDHRGIKEAKNAAGTEDTTDQCWRS